MVSLNKFLIMLMVVMLPTLVVGQDIELSHNSSSTGPHFSEATYGAKFGSMSIGAKYE